MAIGRKNKTEEPLLEESNFKDETLSVHGEEKKRKKKQNSQRDPGGMAPIALIVSFAFILAIVFSLFFRPGSSLLVIPDITSDLKIRLSITTQEFATEGTSSGSLNICAGTKSFPGISQAKIVVNDYKDQTVAVIPIKKASSKDERTCYFDLATKDYKKFTGSKLKVSVQFPFGNSNVFTVDVGDKPPFGRIDVNLNLS